MMWEEAFLLTGDTSVRCRDGMLGEIVRWDEARQCLGIQVPRERTIRVVPVERLLNLGGGVLVEAADSD